MTNFYLRTLLFLSLNRSVCLVIVTLAFNARLFSSLKSLYWIYQHFYRCLFYIMFDIYCFLWLNHFHVVSAAPHNSVSDSIQCLALFFSLSNLSEILTWLVSSFVTRFFRVCRWWNLEFCLPSPRCLIKWHSFLSLFFWYNFGE